MKTPEDEAFDELATRQGDWGSGFQTKPWNEDEWRRNNWRCGHGWLRGEQCKSCNAAQEPPSEWAGIKAILDEYGLQAIDFVANFKAALAQLAQESYDQTALELCNVCGWKTLIPDDGCLNCERAQPAQEPVAHVYLFDDDGRPLIAWNNAKGIKIGDKLYTAPPQRTWVGLTDEQQEEMYQMTDNIADCRTCYFKGIADAEAAHNRGAKP